MGLLPLESPAIFDEKFKFILEPFYIPDFNLLGCELANFTNKILY